MNIEEVEAFLRIIECGSFTSAAEKLFLTQSTTSHRLKALENELGVELIHRRKGSRSLDMTQAGEEFLPLAKQWISLWYDTKRIGGAAATPALSVGSVDAINSFTFVPLYKNIVEERENIHLFINTHHSGEIHGLLENRSIDVGYVFSQIRYPDIISEIVFREKMYLLCHKDSNYRDNLHPHQLRAEDEVFLNWGLDFQIWHDRFWHDALRSKVTVNTGSMLPLYLNVPGNWAIAPMSVVQALQPIYSLACYRLSEEPPPRFCYELTHRYPRPSRVRLIKLFQEKVRDFIKSSQHICRFEPWMLADDA